MILHTVDDLGRPITQGSSEWWRLRLGVATASEFHRIVTEARWDFSKAAEDYAVELLLEEVLEAPLDMPPDWADRWKDAPTEGRIFTSWTERGKVLEHEARTLYEAMREVEVEQVGFITTDDGEFGYSPDGLVGSDGTIEIKSRALKGYGQVVLGLKEIAKATQIQSGLWISEREYCDVVLYMPHERFPTFVDRVYRNDKMIEAIAEAAEKFKKLKAKFRERLDAVGSGVWAERGDDLEALLRASLIIAGDAPEGEMTAEEIEEFSAAVAAGVAAGVIDLKDRRAIVADIEARNWESCRSMWVYLNRHNMEVV